MTRWIIFHFTNSIQAVKKNCVLLVTGLYNSAHAQLLSTKAHETSVLLHPLCRVLDILREVTIYVMCIFKCSICTLATRKQLFAHLQWGESKSTLVISATWPQDISHFYFQPIAPKMSSSWIYSPDTDLPVKSKIKGFVCSITRYLRTHRWPIWMRCCSQQPALQPNTPNFSSHFLKKRHCFEARRKTAERTAPSLSKSPVYSDLALTGPKKIHLPRPILGGSGAISLTSTEERHTGRLQAAQCPPHTSPDWVPVWGWARQQARGPHMCSQGLKWQDSTNLEGVYCIRRGIKWGNNGKKLSKSSTFSF